MHNLSEPALDQVLKYCDKRNSVLSDKDRKDIFYTISNLQKKHSTSVKE
ncbi:MAG: hypothetical protein AB8U25_03155 [Rickettsiales endosymbiont of Dermacentor nuttalli]